MHAVVGAVTTKVTMYPLHTPPPPLPSIYWPLPLAYITVAMAIEIGAKPCLKWINLSTVDLAVTGPIPGIMRYSSSEKWPGYPGKMSRYGAALPALCQNWLNQLSKWWIAKSLFLTQTILLQSLAAVFLLVLVVPQISNHLQLSTGIR